MYRGDVTRIWNLDNSQAILELRDFHDRTHWFNPKTPSVAIAELVKPVAPQSGAPQPRDFTGRIHFFDLSSARETRVISVTKLPYGIRFDPTGTKLAVSYTDDPTLEIFDVASGHLERKETFPAAINQIAWHPNGRWLAGAGANGRVYFWDISADQVRESMAAQQAAAIGLSFSHQGDLLITGGWDSHARLWDAHSGAELSSLPASRVWCEFSGDDRWTGFVPVSGKLGILEIAPGRECQMLYAEAMAGRGTKGCAFSPDGRYLASTHDDGLRLWDLSTRGQIAFQSTVGETFSLRFHGSRQSLITSGQSGVTEWPMKAASDPASEGMAIGSPVLMSPPADRQWDYFGCNDQTFAVASGNKIHLYDLATRHEQAQLGGDITFRFTALSPDGQWCAAGSFLTNLLYIFSARSLQTMRVVPSCPGVGRAVFSPDSRWLILCGSEQYQCINTANGRLAWAFQRKAAGDIKGFASFSADSRTLAVADSEQAVRLMDPATGQEFATLQPREQQIISALAWSPDGSKLAVNTSTQFIQLWDLRLIRSELATMGLDWELPPYPPISNK